MVRGSNACFEKCERLSDEAYHICMELCCRNGQYDPVRIKVEYARALAQEVSNWW